LSKSVGAGAGSVRSVKALEAAARKKEQDEKVAQKKAEQKREIERKRAAKAEEDRKAEQERKAAEQQRLQEIRIAAQKQAEQRKIEQQRQVALQQKKSAELVSLDYLTRLLHVLTTSGCHSRAGETGEATSTIYAPPVATLAAH